MSDTNPARIEISIPVASSDGLFHGRFPSGNTPVVATPTFSPVAGTYSSAQSVSILCATTGATIYYTTDGSTSALVGGMPAGTTQEYEGPITVSASETVNAIGVLVGDINGGVGSAAYVISAGGGATEVFNFTTFPAAAEATTLATVNEPNILPGTIAAILPEGVGHASGGLWFKTQQNIDLGFTTRFTFQIPNLANWTVCGFAFAVQNTTATLNPSRFGTDAAFDANCAGYGAYNPATLGSAQQPPINSIGVKFDANALSPPSYPLGGAPSSTGLYVNGGPFGGLLPFNDLNPYGIDLYSGEVFACTIVYDNALELLTMVVQGMTSGAQCRQRWPVNIPFACSSNMNWVGFVAGGADEGSATTFNEAVNILSWSFSTGFNARLATPTLSPAPGSYSGTQSVTISGPSGASLFYTTNGLLPTSVSLPYTGTPISVSENEVIQVVAIQSGSTDSLVGGGAYQINTPNVINFPAGFAAGDGMTLCGCAVLSGSSILLTSTSLSALGEGATGAAWFPVPVNIEAGWSSAFQLQFTDANANGMTFCLQNQPAAYTSNNQNPSWPGGPNVVGASGPSLGYGGLTGEGQGSPGILSSLAIAFDLYTEPNSVGLYTDGATPTGSQVATGLTFDSGHLFNVALSYDGTTLTFSMADATTGANFTHGFPINIPATVGGNTAYAGFTGAMGGEFANQFVMALTFTEGNS